MAGVTHAVKPWQKLPERLDPMLAVLGCLPPEAEDEEWAFEMKWDGVRALTRVEDATVRLVSRNHVDMSVSYPELGELGASLAHRQLLLDGEIVSFEAAGTPSFKRLQKRMHVSDPTAASRLAKSEPVTLLVFDLLHADGHSLLRLPYTQRRDHLEAMELAGAVWRTPPAFAGQGRDAVAFSQQHGLEGVVAKRLSSIYVPGRRSPDWVKVKNVRTQEMIIGGWTPGNGRRLGMIAALLLGLPGPDGLHYAGKVGTGFTDAMLRDLAADLEPLATATSCPFIRVPRPDARNARWVTPQLVGEVAFTEWTDEGRLRHPSWRGLRPDKSPEEIVWES